MRVNTQCFKDFVVFLEEEFGVCREYWIDPQGDVLWQNNHTEKLSIAYQRAYNDAIKSARGV
jgi:hypothetical protein